MIAFRTPPYSLLGEAALMTPVEMSLNVLRG